MNRRRSPNVIWFNAEWFFVCFLVLRWKTFPIPERLMDFCAVVACRTAHIVGSESSWERINVWGSIVRVNKLQTKRNWKKDACKLFSWTTNWFVGRVSLHQQHHCSIAFSYRNLIFNPPKIRLPRTAKRKRLKFNEKRLCFGKSLN